MEHPIKMDDLGVYTPISGNTHIVIYLPLIGIDLGFVNLLSTVRRCLFLQLFFRMLTIPNGVLQNWTDINSSTWGAVS